MFTIPRSRLALSVAAAAAAGAVATVAVSAVALAHGSHAGGVKVSMPAASGGATFFAAVLDGRNEVPVANGPAVGDPDGQAVEVVRVRGNQVSFAVRWKGIAAPTAGHIHVGASGSNGAVQIPFFGTALPDTLDAAVGTVTVSDTKLLDALRSHPEGFYANLHTAEFPGGAVRGQLFDSGRDAGPDSASFVAAVTDGVQIYACTKQGDGTFAFTQHDVRATLQGGVRHSFVHADAGPPQWIAPDGSAVTGKLVTKSANGSANIAELELAATQTGADTGLFADVTEILRLNTQGGVAPAGTCDPQHQPIAQVPYRADYLFLTR